MIIAGLWTYGDWRHVATGCNVLVLLNYENAMQPLECIICPVLVLAFHLAHIHHLGTILQQYCVDVQSKSCSFSDLYILLHAVRL